MSFKKLILFVFALIVLACTNPVVFGQNSQSIITSSLSSGNIKELSKSFDKRIQVTLSNKSEYYSNSQAEIIINDYLNQLGNKNFTIVRSGQVEGGNAEFYIGEIKCSKGVVKVYIFARKVADTLYIQEIRFE